MAYPKKQLVLLCALMIFLVNVALATHCVLSIERDSRTFENGISSIEVFDSFSLSPIQYTITANIVDQNNNVLITEYRDSLEVCNVDKITLELSDTDGVISDVSWYDESGQIISTNFSLDINECKTADYIVVLTSSQCIDSIPVKIICNDIQYEIEELINPGGGSGVIDVNGDGKLDLCAGDTVSLLVNNLIPSQTISYQWLGLPDFIVEGSNTSNPKFYGAAIGNYDVLLLMRNQFGCTSQQQISFSVNGIQNLDIQASTFDNFGNIVSTESIDSLFVNCSSSTSILFSHTGVSTNGNVFVEWLDDEGNLLSNQPSVSISPERDRTYSVLVTDEFGCFEEKQFKVIGNPPSTNLLDFDFGDLLEDLDGDGDLDVCLDDDNYIITINNNASDTLNYLWTGEIITTGENTGSPTLSFPMAGHYTISVLVSNQYGCAQEYIIEIDAYDFDIADEIVYTQACQDGEVNFQFNENNFEFYTWEFTDGNGITTYADENPTHFTYDLSGMYQVRLIPDSGLICLLDTISAFIEIDDQKDLLDINYEVLSCSDGELIVQFYPIIDTSAFSIIDYTWNLNNMSTSFALSPIVTMNSAGDYKAELQMETNDGCIYEASKLFQFDLLQTNFALDTVIACFDETNIALNPNAVDSLEYQWEPNPYFTDLDMPNPFIDADLNYTFEFTISQDFETYTCSSEREIQLIVDQALISNVIVDGLDPSAVLQDDQTIIIYQCDPFTSFILLGNDEQDAVYQWSTDPDFSEANLLGEMETLAVNELPSTGGAIYYRFEKDDCLSPIFIIKIIEIDEPIVNTSFDYESNFDCEPSVLSLHANVNLDMDEIEGYFWTGPNGFSSSEPSPQMSTTGNENGIYILTITNKAGCQSSTTLEVAGVVAPNLSDPVIQNSGLNCAGEQVILSIAEQVGLDVSYNWTYPTATGVEGLGTNELTIANFDESLHLGQYSVQVIKGDCISSIDSLVLESIISVVPNTELVCQGGQLFLEINAPFGVSFVWTGPQSFYSEERNPILQNVNPSNNGTYTVEVENTNGCMATVEFIIDNILTPETTPIIQADAPTCIGDPILLSTDIVGTSYQWIGPLGMQNEMTELNTNTPTTTINVSSQAYLSGDWKVIVTDENGCTSVSQVIDIAINDIPDPSILGDEMVCEGGILKLFAAPTSDATYRWYDEDPSSGAVVISNAQNIEIQNIEAGFYTYYLSVNLNGCPSEIGSKFFLVEDRPVAKPLASFTYDSDCVATGLQLDASLSGLAPFQFEWTGPNNFTSNEEAPILSNISGSINGIYYLQVVDSNGCSSAERNIEVLEVPEIQPSVEIISDNAVICEGGDLSISSVSSNAVSYLWVGPSGFTSTDPNIDIANVSFDNNGIYSLTVISTEGCEATASIEINQIIASSPSPSLFSESTCTGENLILESNAVSDSYTWIPPSDSLANLQTANSILQITPQSPYYIAGEWSLQVQDENGCLSSQASTLAIISSDPEVTVTDIGDVVICAGGNLIISTESNNATTFSWIGPNGYTSSSADINIENVSIANNGLYTLTVTSLEGCEATVSIMVDQIISTAASPSLFSESICVGENLILETNTVSDLYTWISPSENLATIETTSGVLEIIPQSPYYIAGEWSLQVQDENGCPSDIANSLVDILDIPEVPFIQADNTNICPGESLVLSIANPQGQVSYRWILPDLTIIVTDEPELIIDDIQANFNGSTISVFASNQFCSSGISAAIEISIVSNVNLEDQLIGGRICIEEDVQLFAPLVADANYQWTGPNNFTSNLQNPILEIVEGVNPNGDYFLSIITEAGCTSNGKLTLDLEPGIEAPIISSDITSYCIGDLISIFSTEYFGEQVEYKWTFPASSGIDNAVTQTNQLVINEATIENAGFYSVAVFVDGCLSYSSEDLFIKVNEEPSVSLISNYTICAYSNEELALMADVLSTTGAYTYSWSGPFGFYSEDESPILTDLNPNLSGVYTLTLSDESGCSASLASTTVQINDIPQIPSISSNSVKVCEGEFIEFNIQNFVEGVTYTWMLSDGSQVQSNSATLSILDASPDMHNGVYSVSASEDECVSASSNELTIEVVGLPDELDISNSTALNPACAGEFVQLIGPKIPGAVYTWLGPNDYTSNEQSPVLNESRPNDSGIYTLYVDIEGCRSTISETEVIIDSIPLRATIEDIGVVCEQSDVILRVLNPDPELFYDWYRATENVIIGTGPTFSIFDANSVNEGAYQVIARTAYCSTEKSLSEFLRVEDPNNSIAFAGEDIEICIPEYILGTEIQNDIQGFWTLGDSVSDAAIIDRDIYQTRVVNLAEGNNQFIWTVTNAVCSEKIHDTMSIWYTPYPITRDDSYDIDLNFTLLENVIQNDILGTDDYTIRAIAEPQYGTLILDANGTFEYNPDMHFSGEDKFVYEVCNSVCPEECVQATVFINIGAEYDCFVPSIFSPNEDGKNDSFIIPFLSQYRRSKITIFNRWGDQVYYSDDYQNEWAGTYKGGSLPTGTYYYILQVNDEQATIKQGYVFIQR